MDVARDDTASPEVLWTFYSHAPDISPSLAERLEVGLSVGESRSILELIVMIFPKGAECLAYVRSHKAATSTNGVKSCSISNAAVDEITKQVSLEHIPAKQEENEDRPPFVEIL